MPKRAEREQSASTARRTRRGVTGLLMAVAGYAVWWGVAREPDRVTPRNVLLITIDTLRADAIGAYGNGAATTPWIDRLAAGGVRFNVARAHNVLTLPSHANILTGRLPVDHGVRDNAGFRLPAAEATLATRLKARSFHTGAFISAFPLDSRFGLSRGFDVYDDAFVDAVPRPAFLEQERAATDTVAAAARWLEERKKMAEPWFGWLHLYEPHYPYAPPAAYASRFSSDPYAGEVAATDAALGPLLQPILDAGMRTDTMVILTADHGESLGDHGEATHGIFAYEATLRVPLVFYYPPLLTPGVVDVEVTHVDIVPTILETLGMPPVEGLRGRSLAHLSRERSDDPASYFEALSGSLNRGWAPLSGVVSNGMKYIDLPIPELYDLRADPGERHNLAEARPQELAERRERLRSFEKLAVRRVDETSEVKERLRSLGYLASSASDVRRTYLAADDPKRLIGLETVLQEIVDLYLAGDTPQALARARALVAQHPDMRAALLQLAHLERESGNLPNAIEALRHALKVHPGDAEAASLLGAYLTAANRSGEAAGILQPYARLPDADPQVLIALALAHARSGRFADARQTIDKARGQDPSNAMLLVTQGTVELMAGRRPEARAAFESALALNPGIARASSSLAALAVEEGRPEESLVHWRRAIAVDPVECEKLLAVAVSLARAGRSAEARPYFQLFVEAAPQPRYAQEVASVRAWLNGEGR
jgi:choline-sulfatase